MNDLTKKLKEAIFNVMEQMFFFLPDEETAPGNPDYDVYIGISGEPNYLVSLMFDKELAVRMAENLLDPEDELDDETVRKNLKEAANVIGGRFLLSFDADENRNVTLPSLDKESVFPGAAFSSSENITVSYEGCPVKAVVEVAG